MSSRYAAPSEMAWEGLLVLLLMLPWLYPFATGPSPSVPTWLFALGCATLLWLGRARLSSDLMLRGWRWAAAISVAVGLVQYAGWSAHFWPWIVATPPGEAFANLRQRNQFATLTNIGLAAVVWSRAAKQEPSSNPGIQDILLTALLATGNAATSSRTGAVQLVLLAGLVWAWGTRRHIAARRLLLWAALVYGIATIALPELIGAHADEHGIWARLREGEAVCGSRYPLWMNVLYLITLRPWTGWGWGELDYAHFITQYPGERFCEILDNAHNLPLHLAVELGVPLTLLMAALAVRWIWKKHPWREAEPMKQAAWAILALIALHSLLEYPLWYGPFQITAGLCLCLLASPHGQSWRAGGGIRTVGRATAIGLLFAAGYASWDYYRVSQLYLPPENRSAVYREHTLEKVRDSWLFSDQVRFAEYTLTPLTRENAAQLYAMGLELLHYSPEPRVVEKLIDSALLLGRNDEARLYLARYRAAYPREYAQWVQTRRRSVPPGN